MDFAPDDRTTELTDRALEYSSTSMCCPAELVLDQQLAAAPDEWSARPIVRDLQATARASGAVEPVPARVRGGRADEPAVRAGGRSHGVEPTPRACGLQLRRTRHRQYGGARPVRQRGAEGAVARSAAAGRHPLVVLHDRARHGVVRCDQHRHPNPPRWRRLRDHRPQVVVDRGDESGCRDLHRDGQDRPRGRPPPTAVDDPRAARHPRRADRARLDRVRLRRSRPRRPRRDRIRRRAGAGVEPDRRGGFGLRYRAGTTRTRSHPPLHAGARHG